ncbi:polyprenyl synthetase family protein, partial [Streptomyces sp. SID5914]|nr:polyprenyl synthetase family protein [Streptomyces sp. SID5914]
MTETRRGGTATRRSTGAPERHGPIGTQREKESGESSEGPGRAVAEGHEAAVLLSESRASVDPELRSAIASLPESMRRIALYHFGW